MKKELLISIAWNLLFLLGGILLAFGFWMAWHPLGFIVLGLFVMVLAYGGGFEQIAKGGRRR